jgi:hypothetical protein
MGDHSGSADADAPAGQLSGYLSDISNLPRCFTAMTSAEPAGQGSDNYHGYLDVTGDAATAPVRVFLHTGRAGSGDIDRGITGTLAHIKQLAEAGRAPGPAS